MLTSRNSRSAIGGELELQSNNLPIPDTDTSRGWVASRPPDLGSGLAIGGCFSGASQDVSIFTECFTGVRLIASLLGSGMRSRWRKACVSCELVRDCRVPRIANRCASRVRRKRSRHRRVPLGCSEFLALSGCLNRRRLIPAPKAPFRQYVVGYEAPIGGLLGIGDNVLVDRHVRT